MADRSIQASMTSSDPEDRRKDDWRAAAMRASNPGGIGFTRIPIMATQRLSIGEILTISNGSADGIDIELGGFAWSIPRGGRQAFGPFREGHLSLVIRPIRNGRPDRPPSTIKIQITPNAGIGGRRIIGGQQESTWEWDGSQAWRTGIPYWDE